MLLDLQPTGKLSEIDDGAERVVLSPPYSARCKTPIFQGAYLATELQHLSQGSQEGQDFAPRGYCD